jgi:anti-sigma factor RsiW
MTEHGISDEELHAFIDGELSPADMRRVEAIVNASPALQEQVELFAADMALIHDIYAPLIDQPLPTAVLEALKKGRPERRSFFRSIPWRFMSWQFPVGAVAAAVLVVVGVLAYPNLIGGGDPLVAEALAAQNGELQTERSVPPAALAMAKDRIAEDTLAKPVKIPDLEKAGYALKGIVVFAKAHAEHSLQARYENAAGQSFVVYMRSSAGPDRFDIYQRGKTQICVWQNDDLSVVMTGDMSAREMLKVANLTYSDLNF